MTAAKSRRTIKPKTSRSRRSAGDGAPSAVEAVTRAVDMVRRGAAVRIRGERDIVAVPAETLSDRMFAKLAALRKSPPLLLLTHARARTLKIRLYTPEIVALPLDAGMRAEDVRAIADPTGDLDHPLRGPFDTLRETLPASLSAAVKLAKLAGLLPAAVVQRAPNKVPFATELRAADIDAYDREIVRTLTLVTRARVPLEGAEHAELAAFRPRDGAPEHYAIIINQPSTQAPVLARLHSECFTGDLLASLKCDCGSQLRGAIEALAAAGGGVLLYLAQEGRGIGLINKLRAYRLQDQGFDTIEANERLGFEADERLYGIAAKMLTMLGYKSVRLLTNNPHKMAALDAAGIKVVERVPHAFPAHDHNRAYLKTKAEKGGHLL